MKQELQDKIDLAKAFAERKFKESNINNHYLEVFDILRNNFKIDDVDILIAGLLHDTIEDTNTSYEEIGKTFGKNVANMVDEVSHPKNYNAEQKKEYYEKIKHISWGGKMIKLADFKSHLKNFIGAFTGENNLKKFTHNEYCLYIRSFLLSCDNSLAKDEVTKLNDQLDNFILNNIKK
jgi:hypothetical protein